MRYEDLHQDCFNELEKISRFLNLSVQKSKLEKIVEDNSFEKRTKRKKGEENKGNHNRKGIIGDYKSMFNATQLKSINIMLGDALERMGYN